MACRILVVNSNTTESVTDRIADAAKAALPEGCTVETMSAPFGLTRLVTQRPVKLLCHVPLEPRS